MYKRTTQIPNLILDQYLRILSAAELKILLVIIRQTVGWVKPGTEERKTRDRISHSQFMRKTGLSRRVISKAISKLLGRGLITVSDQYRNSLSSPSSRSGRSDLYYSPTCALSDTDLRTLRPKPVHKVIQNKTNYTKLNETKLRGGSVQSVGQIIANMAIPLNKSAD